MKETSFSPFFPVDSFCELQVALAVIFKNYNGVYYLYVEGKLNILIDLKSEIIVS
jgi:hypothetical protein